MSRVPGLLISCPRFRTHSSELARSQTTFRAQWQSLAVATVTVGVEERQKWLIPYRCGPSLRLLPHFAPQILESALDRFGAVPTVRPPARNPPNESSERVKCGAWDIVERPA